MDDNLIISAPRNANRSRKRTLERRNKISTSSTAAEPDAPAKRRRKIYDFEKSFDNLASAEKFLETEMCWSRVSRKFTSDGDTIYYRCNLVKKSGPQCPAKVHLVCKTQSLICLYRAEDEHDHSNRSAGRGLPVDVKTMVTTLYEDGVQKPTAIARALNKRGLTVPKSRRITNFLQRYKKRTKGKARITLGEFTQWCDENSTPPIDRDQGFVVDYDCNESEDGKYGLIRIFMSTPGLLELATRTDHLHADGTYKCIAERLPVIGVGTTDRDRHFHPFGLGITSEEKAADYGFIFGSVASGVRRLHNHEYRPDTLIADGADAITNGFSSVFGQDFKRVMCWAHVMRKIRTKAQKLIKAANNQEYCQRILDDVTELQICESEAIFDVATRLFFQKWRSMHVPEIDQFLDYFKAEWIRSHKNWFEGYAKTTPSTNNALESSNLRLKADDTHRVREPLARFLTLVLKTVLPYWSKQRNPEIRSDQRPFVAIPTKTLDVWTGACRWVAMKKTIHPPSNNADGSSSYYIPADNQESLPLAAITEYRASFRRLNWASFEAYALQRNRLWIVRMTGDDWENATCNCPPFLKKYVCKHVVGLAIERGLCVPPRNASTLPIGPRGKPGRPRLARDALTVD